MTSYHHGNLREALLAEALKQLVQSGAEKLSLRALARTVGVSQTAPYRHFPDKKALLIALATDGFHQLNRKTHAAADAVDEPELRIIELGLAYIEFATIHPELYKMMFGPILNERENHEDLKNACMAGMGFFCDCLRQFLNCDDNEIIWHAAIGGRAFVHGLANMKIDGLTMECAEDGVSFDPRRAMGFMLAGVKGSLTSQ